MLTYISVHKETIPIIYLSRINNKKKRDFRFPLVISVYFILNIKISMLLKLNKLTRPSPAPQPSQLNFHELPENRKINKL